MGKVMNTVIKTCFSHMTEFNQHFQDFSVIKKEIKLDSLLGGSRKKWKRVCSWNLEL